MPGTNFVVLLNEKREMLTRRPGWSVKEFLNELETVLMKNSRILVCGRENLPIGHLSDFAFTLALSSRTKCLIGLAWVTRTIAVGARLRVG